MVIRKWLLVIGSVTSAVICLFPLPREISKRYLTGVYNCRDTSTFVGRALQISSFMQNKANFPKSQMNITKEMTTDYENKTLGGSGKNKANSNPIKANSKPIKANLLKDQMNVSVIITKDYENKSNWAIYENKANTNPNKANFPCAQDDIRHPTYNIRNTKPIPPRAEVNIIPLRFASQKRSRGGDLRLPQSENLSIIIEKVGLLLPPHLLVEDKSGGVPESKGRF